MTRRRFGLQLAALAASLWLLPGWGCSKASDLIQSLRQILQSVEKALGALSLVSGLLPDVVNLAAKYLMAVCNFVDAAGQILENDTIAAVDKANQILKLAAEAALKVPVVPAAVTAVLNVVAAALDAFLSHFGANQGNAATARVSTVPNISLGSADRTMLATIHANSLTDAQAVREWAAKNGGKV